MSRIDSGAKPASESTSSGPVAAPTASQRFWREVRGYAEALVIAFLVVTFVFNTVGVIGSSMRPTLHGGSGQMPQSLFTGDRVFIPKYDTWLRRAGVLPMYERGEVVVVREPENAPSAQFRTRRPFFIKRLVAVPGDRVRIEGGVVHVNGVPLDEQYITATGEIRPDPIDFPVVEVQDGRVTGFQGLSPGTYRNTFFGLEPVPVEARDVQWYYGDIVRSLAPLPSDPPAEPFVHEFIVPNDMVFVMGDNRETARGGSEDSRYFGPIPFMTVAGRASAVIWPPQRDGEWNWRRLGPPAAFAAIPDGVGEAEAAREAP